MRPKTSPNSAHRSPADTPRAACTAAASPASSSLFQIASFLFVVSLGLSLAIILPR